ncbi:hypothetical protein [Deinococcus rubellus]|uniref:PEGA domain-containing protein n=1 Tax=Deinococcus rubellus TaxID=1889240 RepID=A0ABY5YFV9_9DEIO|nr:hypothetical protein [Deinococcus rubellus]UWX63277.1 hypothetical protein N0D28_11015 [Deinococcus rubellus]
MKTVGPFVAARSLDTGFSGAAQPVKVLHALDRLTGLPALVYLLPQAAALPELPETPSLLPYIEAGIQGEQAYVACELPPHAGLASDPLQTALGGLRALNALHEAGLVHGGVGPHQLWEWDGEVRLAGAALPWGEAQGALAAPEGGVSPAADLYALGVTLLRMGPLPAGLSDLLSPYPAQRPSARDALARFNAGPPLPTPPAPLMVQAPLHPREVRSAPPPEAPLPLIADPEQRIAPLPSSLLPPALGAAELLPDDQAAADSAGLPVFDWGEVEAGEPPQTVEAGAVPTVQVALTQSDAPSPVPAQPDATESEMLDFLAAFPTDDAQAVSVEAELVAPSADELPAPGGEPAGQLLASADPTPGPVLSVPSPVAQPAEPETQELQSGEVQVDKATGEETQVLVFSSAVPESVITAGEAAQVRPDPSGSETARPDVQPPSTPAPEAAPSASSRQLKSVKIGWSQDGAWQVKKGSEDVAAVGAHTPSPADGLLPLARPTTRVPSSPHRPSANRFNPLWLLVLVLAAVLVMLLAQRAFRSSGPALSAAACCTVTAQLVGSSGQSLSAPVKVSVVSAPAASRLKVGALIGQAPGPLALDTPGNYALNVVGDGYAAQTVNVTVPTAQPLVIKLK